MLSRHLIKYMELCSFTTILMKAHEENIDLFEALAPQNRWFLPKNPVAMGSTENYG
jgi:hypothetical protein